MTPLRVAFVAWPEGLTADDARWPALRDAAVRAAPDILVTNELPFGPWLADAPAFSRAAAEASIAAHAQGIAALAALGLPAVITSRPVWNGERLANEAVAVEGGAVRPLHRKQYFPDEPGWREAAWYAADRSGFRVAEVAGIKVGVLLCTEAMFNERARAYGRQRAALIALLRTSGTDVETWRIAGAMASLVSGAYVVSSNRTGRSRSGTLFGGGGFAYAPQGRLAAVTVPASPLQMFDLDPEEPRAARRAYPCYVPELAAAEADPRPRRPARSRRPRSP